MTALAFDVREITADEINQVSGAIWGAVAAGLIVAAATIVFEDEIKGFKDGLYAGFQDDK